jgi:hypothetical protein
VTVYAGSKDQVKLPAKLWHRKPIRLLGEHVLYDKLNRRRYDSAKSPQVPDGLARDESRQSQNTLFKNLPPL